MLFCWVDDILVSGKTDQKHLQNLDQVLTQLEDVGQRLKLMKCTFMQPSVEYLGYRIDTHSLHAIEEKVKAIRKVPKPQNKQQLRSFLGMENYYAKFIPNYSTFAHPLNELLRDQVQFKWTSA